MKYAMNHDLVNRGIALQHRVFFTALSLVDARCAA
jgi:hypothetical protein